MEAEPADVQKKPKETFVRCQTSLVEETARTAGATFHAATVSFDFSLGLDGVLSLLGYQKAY
jgi:hypothetical protein